MILAVITMLWGSREISKHALTPKVYLNIRTLPGNAIFCDVVFIGKCIYT